MDRRGILRSMFDLDGCGLEIGPSYNPLLPKSGGYRVETLDHMDRAELVAKYAAAPGVDVSAIEDVDYVSDGRPVAQVVPRRDYYDFIVASHVIEHVADPIGFINDCASMLKPKGRLVLAVPDKRTSFDAIQPLSSPGQMLDARLGGRAKATPGAVFDAFAYDVLFDGQPNWFPRDGGPQLAFAHTLDSAAANFEIARGSSRSFDVHLWRFTPTTFRLAIADLRAIGAIRMGEAAFDDSLAGEFFIALDQQASREALDRMALIMRILAEQAQAPVTQQFGAVT